MQDALIADAMFCEGGERYDKLISAYGGYWRFPGLDDFYYFINPYFPTKKMIEKMKSEYPMLLGNYPSSLKIQNMNAERIFGVSKEMHIVGTELPN